MQRDTTRTISRVLEALLPEIRVAYEQGGRPLLGLSTGLPKIDEYTGGLKPDELWIIGATTSTGKTAAALGIALTVARQGVGVIYFSLEMSAESLVARLLSAETNIPPLRLRRGLLSAEEYEDVVQAGEALRSLPLLIIDRSFTSEELSQHALTIAEHEDIGLVVVDYAQILRDAPTFGEAHRIGAISGNMRELARPTNLNAPVILVSQLNRAISGREDKLPMLSDLKGASDLEQDAEVVLLPHRPALDAYRRGEPLREVEEDALIIIGKNRNGPTGALRSRFYPKQMRWSQDPPAMVSLTPMTQPPTFCDVF